VTVPTTTQHVPGRPGLVATIILGAAILTLGIAAWVWLLTRIDWEDSPFSSEPSIEQEAPEESHTPWYYWATPLVPLMAGVIIMVTGCDRFSFYHRQVSTGQIVKLNVNYHYSLHWITVYGPTRAGEMRHYTHTVDYGTWERAKIGSPFPVT